MQCNVCGTKVCVSQISECKHYLCRPCRAIGPICPASGCSCPLTRLPDATEEETCLDIGCASCTECFVSVDVSRLYFRTCPHSIFCQISPEKKTSHVESEDLRICLPSELGTKPRYITLPPDSRVLADAKRDVVLRRSDSDTIIIASCRRNLILRSRSSKGSLRFGILRGMSEYNTTVAWPEHLEIYAPGRIRSPKPSLCRLLQPISRRDVAGIHVIEEWCLYDLNIFSAELQFVTHPAFNSLINSDPVIGSSKIYKTKHLTYKGVFCSCCRRSWPIRSSDDASLCIDVCGEPDMVDANIQSIQLLDQTIESPLSSVKEAVEMPVRSGLSVPALDLVGRFGWIKVPETVIPSGCIAILAAKGSSEGLALFHTRLRCDNVRDASVKDVFQWILKVHPRGAWKKVRRTHLFEAESDDYRLITPCIADHAMDFISVPRIFK